MFDLPEIIKNLFPLFTGFTLLSFFTINRYLKRKNKRYIGIINLKNNEEFRNKQLIDNIYKKLDTKINDNVQDKVVSLLFCLNKLDLSKDSYYIKITVLAIEGLLIEEPNLIFAGEVHRILMDYIRPVYTSTPSLILKIFQVSPAGSVVLGMAILFYIVIPISFSLFRREMPSSILGISTNLLLVVIIFGFIGSIVSIMSRIQDFSKDIDTDSTTLILIGLFKPIVGTSFALFIFGILKSGLIPININVETEVYFFIALSFIAGFSERFAKDIISKTESQISSIQSINKQSQK